MASPNVDLFAKLLFFLCRFNWNNWLFPISLIVCRYIIPCGHVWQKLLNLQLDPSAIAVCAKVVMFSVISTFRACKLHSLWFAWYCNVPLKLNWKATAGWENGLAAWKITWSRACNNEEGPGDHVCFRGRSADRWPKSVSGRPTVDRCRSVVGRLSVTTFSTREIASKMVEKFNPSLNYTIMFSVRVQLNSYWDHWKYFRTLEPFWTLELFRKGWTFFGTISDIHKNHFGNLQLCRDCWNHFGTLEPFWDHWHHFGAAGTIWQPLEPVFEALYYHFGTIWEPWNHSRTTGTIFNPGRLSQKYGTWKKTNGCETDCGAIMVGYLIRVLLCMWDERIKGRQHGACTNHLRHPGFRLLSSDMES